jgi:hypothetical protein
VSSPVALADIALGSDMRRGSLGPLPRNGVEAWPEPVTGALLLNDMARTLRRFVVLPEAARDAEALWTLNTYVYDIASILPNLCLSSPEKRCGKTRNLEVLGCLWINFAVFDILWLDGEDLRHLPLIERKKRLSSIRPATPSFLFYVDHLEECGRDLFAAACAKDLEGIIAKPKQSTYNSKRTRWFKMKNPHYSQRVGRPERFGA